MRAFAPPARSQAYARPPPGRRDRGRAVDVIIGLWSLSVQGTVIGVVGSLSIHERCVKAFEALAAGLHAAAADADDLQHGSKLQHLEMDLHPSA